MKCPNIISYGNNAQIKFHRKHGKNTEVCNGSIDVEIHPYVIDGDEENCFSNYSGVIIGYTCIKCRKSLKPVGFPADSDDLRSYLIEKLEEAL